MSRRRPRDTGLAPGRGRTIKIISVVLAVLLAIALVMALVLPFIANNN